MLIGVLFVLLLIGSGMAMNINIDNPVMERRVNKIGWLLLVTGVILGFLTFYFGWLIPAQLA